jgi:hypothetical protein
MAPSLPSLCSTFWTVLMVVVPAQVADHLRGDSFQVFGTNPACCLTHQTVA